jgi:cytochrome c oxidase cbb3-type subunit 1
MITIGSLYAMAPRALGRPAMYSHKGMEVHFRLHLAGTLIYVFAMWAAGVTEGLMWRATSADGALTYSFLDSLIAAKPWYIVRWFGGVLIWLGMWVMAWNLWYTAADARAKIIKPIPVPIPEPVVPQVPAPLPAAG